MLARYKISRGDIFGGLTAAILALPLCLAFGVASGLGPVAGLYGGIVLGIVASLFGGTPVQISGPTAPMTLVAAGVIAANIMPNGEMNLAQIVAVFLLAGAFQVLFGVVRLGQYIRFMPYPVLSGLMTGIGIILIIQQLFPAAGLPSPSSNPIVILSSLDGLQQDIRFDSVLLAAATVVLVSVLPRLFHAVPASLVALVTLTLVAVVFGLGVPTIGEMPGGLPTPVFPKFELVAIQPVLVAAIQLAFLGSLESLKTSLVADNMTKTHHNSNRELIGQGLGNMCAAIFGGLPGAGAVIRTAVNIRTGGQHHSSGIIHGLFLLAVLLGLSNVVQHIPHAVLAGILIGAGLSIIDYRSLSHILKVPRADIVLMLVVVALTIFAGLITAVAVGMVLAAFFFMVRIAHASEKGTKLTLIDDEPWADEFSIPEEMRNRLLIKHVSGPLFFGFVHAFRSIIDEARKARMLVLRMEQVSYMDQSGLYALQDILIDFDVAGIPVFLVGMAPELLDQLEAIRVIPDLLERDHVFENFDTFRKALPKLLG